jgi:hypothetical protein
MNIQKLTATLVLAIALMGISIKPAQAYDNSYYENATSFLGNHPYVKDGLIGSAAGAVIGGVMAHDGDRTGSAVKGAVLGGAAGMGVEYLREKGAFSRHSNW